MLVSLTVGKVDAGVAVLLTDDKRLVSIMIVSLLLRSVLCGVLLSGFWNKEMGCRSGRCMTRGWN